MILLILMFLAIASISYAIFEVFKQNTGRDWLQVYGVSLGSEIVLLRGEGGDNEVAECRYSYSVSGKTYRGCARFGVGFGHKYGQRWPDQFPERGARIVVYCDPKRPERSVLEPRYRNARALVLSLFLFVLFSVVGFFYAMSHL